MIDIHHECFCDYNDDIRPSELHINTTSAKQSRKNRCTWKIMNTTVAIFNSQNQLEKGTMHIAIWFEITWLKPFKIAIVGNVVHFTIVQLK